ncbi:MAG: aldehyde dehydrogenase family protein [Phycisphaerales bacterium]|nr:aldehyde dehydrogenase family protein [Phycisphaerales bacterium]
MLKIINPANGLLIKTIETDTSESLAHKFNQLKNGKKDWQNVPITDRIAILTKWKELLIHHKQELASILTQEMGKPIKQALAEIEAIANITTEWFCKNTQRYLMDEIVHDTNEWYEKIVYEPKGVICHISAWNYPYSVGANVIVPGLLAGNAIMYKPSEYTTLTGLKIQELFYQAGVPQSAFQIAIGAQPVGEALLSLPFDGYYFTGSSKTGKFIYEKVANKLVTCELEMGGKDPVYICEDIKNIDEVVAVTADGAFYNTGQSCCSVERIYVHEKIYDDYVRRFVQEVKRYKMGDPTKDDTYLGPLSRQQQLTVLEKQVKDAVDKGATVLCGGGIATVQHQPQIHAGGYFFEPTVLVNVTQNMSVMREESFGPIVGIAKVATDTEACSLMADTEYGLTAAVFSDNQTRALKILQQLEVGTIYHNCCERVKPWVPWSGRKQSGIGHVLSSIGIRALTKPKAYQFKK